VLHCHIARDSAAEFLRSHRPAAGTSTWVGEGGRGEGWQQRRDWGIVGVCLCFLFDFVPSIWSPGVVQDCRYSKEQYMESRIAINFLLGWC